MPALNFQKQFVPAIMAGLLKDKNLYLEGRKCCKTLRMKEILNEIGDAKPKRQTIRAFRKDGRDPKAGDKLYLYTGMRTKNCIKLGEVICKEVSEIEISDQMIFLKTALIQGPLLTWQARALAQADGFEDLEDMQNWFKQTHDLPFKGVLIK